MTTPAVTAEFGMRERLVAYVMLTKPRIIELLLVTTVPTMVVAERGIPDLWLVVATLIGGTLAAGSANVFNCYLDQDIDQVMHRTERRPLARHQVPPRNALRFGVVLGVASFVWLSVTVNLLSAALGVAAILFYVFVYTMLLKRRTSQNIVIGGAAGCMPVLIGWTAVTGELALAPWFLFAIVYYWTPPHFWALAVKYRDDYARAGVPMLPVVRGVEDTTRQILLYTLIMVAVTLMFGPFGDMGLIYLIASLVLGALFIAMAVQLYRQKTEEAAMRLFRFSISYLGLLFVAMAVDAVVYA
jgi:protoheme IX farnesyltransferase